MPFNYSSPSIPNDVFAHRARHIIRKRIATANLPLENRGPIIATDIVTKYLSRASLSISPVTPTVGILGAGSCGLYTALILSDLEIPFEVIEARDRVGGRLYTHKFCNNTGAPYNYFDVGAMRFPDHISMRRVFHLFNYPPLNNHGLSLSSKIVPFYSTAVDSNAFSSFNGATYRQNSIPSSSTDPWKGREVIFDVDDPRPFYTVGPEAILNDAIYPFALALYEDLENNMTSGWEKLMEYDQYSVRAYLSIAYRPSAILGLPDAPLTTDVVNWIETVKKSTGTLDKAFSELVIDSVAFGFQPNDNEKVKWYCVDGGASEIANTMYAYLRRMHPESFNKFQKPVTAISTVKTENGRTMHVVTNDKDVHKYSHVISTIPLPVLRTVDTRGADLSTMQASAIRHLTYGPSVKIGMQFRTAWWTLATNDKGEKLNIVGGQSFTDRPLKTIVYPSFGDAEGGKTTTLIASYIFADDAEKWSALCVSKEKADVEYLTALVLRELAIIHDVQVDFLEKQLLDIFSWSWSQDPFTRGAFAFFGPGKFQSPYIHLTAPAAQGHLHFAGEALSPRHAWVEGAFDSAWRAVLGMIISGLNNGFTTEQLYKLLNNWGTNAEWWSPGYQMPMRTPRDGEGSEELDGEKALKDSLFIEHLALAASGY